VGPAAGAQALANSSSAASAPAADDTDFAKSPSLRLNSGPALAARVERPINWP
jgi:hypothetical protein